MGVWLEGIWSINKSFIDLKGIVLFLQEIRVKQDIDNRYVNVGGQCGSSSDIDLENVRVRKEFSCK